MPAYIYIQCFVKCNEETFTRLLNNFGLALHDIGFPDNYIRNHVDILKWELSDNGCMYSGCDMPSILINICNYDFNVRPIVMGFTPDGYEGLKENWVEVALLFMEDEIAKDYGTGAMFENSKETIWLASNILSKHFPEAIVFLADEITDALPWEATLGLCENLYAFDLAIIPSSHSYTYTHIPKGYKAIDRDDKTYIIRMEVWGEIYG